jgi:NTP pyrophosphatase (non-canonical NTP hydrolase)
VAGTASGARRDTNRLLRDIAEERRNQDRKCGRRSVGRELGLLRSTLVLSEEVGEVSEAALALDERRSEDALQHLRDELVQVGAVAWALLERVDRGDFTSFAIPFPANAEVALEEHGHGCRFCGPFLRGERTRMCAVGDGLLEDYVHELERTA